MKLLYFAWLRSRIGCAQEQVVLPAEVVEVSQLLEWLRSRGEGYRAALADLSVIQVAVNQEHVSHQHPLQADDEVALFPPVTGG